jgi:two-component system chemotaxis response regulator CheY
MEERPFDLVLLDILIPEPNGQEVLQVLREIEASRDIGFEDNVKVIMTSSLDDPMNVVTAFQHGCEGYVTKPFKKEHLEAEMRKVGLL